MYPAIEDIEVLLDMAISFLVLLSVKGIDKPGAWAP